MPPSGWPLEPSQASRISPQTKQGVETRRSAADSQPLDNHFFFGLVPTNLLLHSVHLPVEPWTPVETDGVAYGVVPLAHLQYWWLNSQKYIPTNRHSCGK